nr:PAAR domain-containing protein [uncultured Pseudomonas sp.]
MSRITINGKRQALEGDKTTTGSICIASDPTYWAESRQALRLGDVTTECPICKKPGVIAEGVPSFVIKQRPAVIDGALVECGCPLGSNRVIAQQGAAVANLRSSDAPTAARTFQVSAESLSPAQAYSATLSELASELEPGFHIVQRSTSFEQLLKTLEPSQVELPISSLKRLNPTYMYGFKAGEVFVLNSPRSHFSCTAMETELMMVADKARASLAILEPEEANFMMEHLGEIAGVLNGASQSMGVGKDMLERGLGQVKDTLQGIEKLHQRQFVAHGHLRSPEFFASRKDLYKQLEAQLRTAFLNKPLNLGSYDSLRRDLGISPKSLVHHWKKAGAPGAIPGYATHLDEVAKMSKYLKYGGRVGIGLGAGSSYLRVHEACRAGETEECRKIRYTESGSFAGGVAGGGAGAAAGRVAAAAVCQFGIWGKAACGIVTVGASAFGMSSALESIGEVVGEEIYEFIYD